MRSSDGRERKWKRDGRARRLRGHRGVSRVNEAMSILSTSSSALALEAWVEDLAAVIGVVWTEESNVGACGWSPGRRDPRLTGCRTIWYGLLQIEGSKV